MALPRYVEYGGLVCCPTPFSCRNTKLDGFFVKADAAKLDALCRRVFHDPTDGAVEYVAMGDYVMLAWGVTDAASMWHEPNGPGEVPWNQRGAVSEPQMCVWVPAAAVKRQGGQVHADRFLWFLPYIWVDNAMSLATGRETLGYPKTFAKFESPLQPEWVQGSTPSWKVETFGLNFGPQSKAGYHPLIEVTQTGGFGSSADDNFDSLADLGRHIGKELFGTTSLDDVRPDLHFVGSAITDFLHSTMRQVFFKQFRSAEDGLGASLQQVVEAAYKITDIHGFPYPHVHDYELKVHPLDSHPLFDDLGLAPQKVKAAYHVEMDFEVRDGHVLWERCGGSVQGSGGHGGHGGIAGWIPSWLGGHREREPV
jgi:hypothetical protein